MDDGLRADRVTCSRVLRDGHESVLRETSLAFEHGTFNVLCGTGGSGRSLLLRLLGLMQKPDSGEIFFRGEPTTTLADDARIRLRNRCFGFLPGEPFLLPTFSVLENVAMPLLKNAATTLENARQQITAALEMVGLAELAETSGGSLPLFQQHKVALARAVAHRPDILLVENCEDIFSPAESDEMAALLVRANEQLGVTVIASAGRRELAPAGNRIVELRDGVVARDTHAA